MKKTTIKDIARLADVSITTVSKIINGKDHDISQATIDKVNRIMAENRYVPNKLAGSLVTKSTKTIGLVIPDITNPFFPELVRGAEDRASEAGYSIFFCNSDDQPEKEQKYIISLLEKMVDGIIFTAASTDKKRLKAIQHITAPIVLVDRPIELADVNASILVSNEQGAFDAVNYLIGLGHKKILHITGPDSGQIGVERAQGYRKALEESGIPFDPTLVKYGNFKIDWGYKALEEMDSEGHDYTAVFCGNDLIALGAMKYLREKGRHIPEDCSVIGFDDIQIASHLDPPLTTVLQPKYQMGYQAVDVMIRLLQGEKLDDGQKTIVLNTELIVRGTCSKPKVRMDE